MKVQIAYYNGHIRIHMVHTYYPRRVRVYATIYFTVTTHQTTLRLSGPIHLWVLFPFGHSYFRYGSRGSRGSRSGFGDEVRGGTQRIKGEEDCCFSLAVAG